MAKQLSPEDRRAVDLVLDRESIGNNAFYAAVTNGMGKRVQNVEKLMHMLDTLPADEPSPNLVSRVMDRIAEAGDSVTTSLPTQPTIAPHLRPEA